MKNDHQTNKRGGDRESTWKRIQTNDSKDDPKSWKQNGVKDKETEGKDWGDARNVYKSVCPYLKAFQI